LAIGKKIIIVKNATAWDWYCHLVVDRASLDQPIFILKELFFGASFKFCTQIIQIELATGPLNLIP
jgi:hypothetical protein